MPPTPGLASADIVDYVRSVYPLHARDAALLPAVSDADVTAYRIECDEGPYFLKLRLDPPPPPLARYLADAGITQVLAPLDPRDGQRAATRIGDRSAIVYPFVEGENAFRRPLEEAQWTALGAIVRSIHDAKPPPQVTGHVRHETYAGAWRGKVRGYLAAVPLDAPNDAATRGLTDLLSSRKDAIVALLEHAEELATSLQQRDLPAVPCHADLHAGNILVADGGALFIVDWDDPVLAPRERDLMFPGAGIGRAWNRPEEVAAFFRGYGAVSVDTEALAFYRCDRIVEDVAAFSDRLLLEPGDPADRQESLRRLAAAFDPNDVVQIAEATFAAL